MPKVIEITVYTFDELSDEAKKVAREWALEAFSYDRCYSVSDFFCERLAELGYPNEDHLWSLSHSQGDGMAFYGQIDLEHWLSTRTEGDTRMTQLVRDIITNFRDVEFTIVKNSGGCRYNHYNTMGVQISGGDGGEDCDIELRKLFLADIKEISQTLEEEGYKILEDKEYLEEDIRANEYTFTESGERFG